MSMTIKELETLLDIPQQTIRFYEKQGILKPKRNPKNNYRIYDNWDIVKIENGIFLRNIGLSLKQAKEIIYDQGIEFFADSIERQKNEIKNKIQYENILVNILNEYCNYARKADLNIGCFWFDTVEEIEYSAFHNSIGGHCGAFEGLQSSYQKWVKAQPLSYRGFRVNIQDEHVSSLYEWLFMMPKQYFDFLHWKKDDTIFSIPKGMCLKTIVRVQNPHEFTPNLFDELLSYVHEKKLDVVDTIYGRVLFHFFNNNESNYYYEVFLPLKTV